LIQDTHVLALGEEADFEALNFLPPQNPESWDTTPDSSGVV